MDNEFQRLHHYEVVSINTENLDTLDVSDTFKVIQLLQAIKELVGLEIAESSLFDQGIECEVLRFRANSWRRGKVRLSLEFKPDDNESPLEDFATESQDAEAKKNDFLKS
ncbi:MAG: KGK domain-containing protein [Calothrix sp. C42_A2020_038]|nr:KGK domain-containing protein [Calothrix sp. C42_A2020_038]